MSDNESDFFSSDESEEEYQPQQFIIQKRKNPTEEILKDIFKKINDEENEIRRIRSLLPKGSKAFLERKRKEREEEAKKRAKEVLKRQEGKKPRVYKPMKNVFSHRRNGGKKSSPHTIDKEVIKARRNMRRKIAKERKKEEIEKVKHIILLPPPPSPKPELNEEDIEEMIILREKIQEKEIDKDILTLKTKKSNKKKKKVKKQKWVSVENVKKPVQKTKVCKSVLIRRPCRNGNKCTFAHSSDELKPIKCRYDSKCRRKEGKCVFIHSNETVIQYLRRLKIAMK